MKTFFCLYFWTLLGLAPIAQGYTANRVYFEFLERGRYRVTVNYTVPSLKENREAYVLFNSKRDAETYYWKLVRGADFFENDPKSIRYVPPKTQMVPW